MNGLVLPGGRTLVHRIESQEGMRLDLWEHGGKSLGGKLHREAVALP